jgi:hypothetical protein
MFLVGATGWVALANQRRKCTLPDILRRREKFKFETICSRVEQRDPRPQAATTAHLPASQACSELA